MNRLKPWEFLAVSSIAGAIIRLITDSLGISPIASIFATLAVVTIIYANFGPEKPVVKKE